MKHMMRLMLSFLLVYGSVACIAQNTSAGDIRGIVTDSVGAVIPDVTVTVVNVNTGVSKDYFTNHAGFYDTSSLEAGSYKLTFIKEGFEELVRGPVTIQVGFTTVSAQLKVG